MKEYLICFAFCVVVSHIAGKSKTPKTKYFLAIVSTVPIIVLAGLRSIYMGADTSNYPVTSFNYSMGHTLVESVLGQQTEWLFSVLAWIMARLTNDVHGILMLMSCITVIPVVVVLANKHPRTMAIGMLVFCLITYCWSINIIRQTAAASLLLLAYVCSERRKGLLFLLVVVLAAGLHNTAWLGLIIWPIIRLSEIDNNSIPYSGHIKILLAMASVALLALMFANAADIISFFAMFKDSYSYQIERLGESEGYVSFSILCLGSLFLYVIVIQRRDETMQKKILARSTPLAVLWLLAWIFSLLGYVSPALFRIGFMFTCFTPLFFCSQIELLEDKRERFIYASILILLSVFYFGKVYVLSGSSGAIPYYSEILAIS